MAVVITLACMVLNGILAWVMTVKNPPRQTQRYILVWMTLILGISFTALLVHFKQMGII